MATIAPTTASGAAVNLAPASAGGDVITFGTASRCAILINNTSGATITVTLAATQTCNQGFAHNAQQACPTGQITRIIPPAQCIDANPATAGQVSLTYSATTNVSVGATAS